MAGLSGVGLAGARLAVEYQAAVIRTQKEALELEGDMAIKLIQAAVIPDEAIGRNLDVAV